MRSHIAEACHDTQCPLSNCVNWKMRNVLGTGNHVTTKKRKNSCASMEKARSHQKTGHAVSKDKTTKRTALPNANPKKARESSSPHGESGTLSQAIGQAQGACVGTDDVPAAIRNSPMALSSTNTTTASQVSYPVPKADSSWIALDSSSCTFGTPLSLTTSFDERDFQQLLQCLALPDVPNASNNSVVTTNCGPLLGSSDYPKTSQAARKEPAPIASLWQDNIAPVVEATALASASANLPLSSNASEVFTSMPASTKGGASVPLMAQTWAHLASQDGHQTASDPANITAVPNTSPNIPTSTAQTDIPQTTLHLSKDSPPRSQYGATSKTGGQEPSTEFIRTVLNYISRVITMLDQPRSNHLKERFISILEEAVCKLENSTVWPRTWIDPDWPTS